MWRFTEEWFNSTSQTDMLGTTANHLTECVTYVKEEQRQFEQTCGESLVPSDRKPNRTIRTRSAERSSPDRDHGQRRRNRNPQKTHTRSGLYGYTLILHSRQGSPRPAICYNSSDANPLLHLPLRLPPPPETEQAQQSAILTQAGAAALPTALLYTC